MSYKCANPKCDRLHKWVCFRVEPLETKWFHSTDCRFQYLQQRQSEPVT